TLYAELRGAALAVDLDGEMAVADRIAFDRTLDRGQGDTLGGFRPARPRGDVLGDLLRLVSKPAGRDQLVDQAPVSCSLAAHALGGGAEEVGVVAPHQALVDQARE